MYLLGVKKVQRCPFKSTAPVTSCCTPKGAILALFVLCGLDECEISQPENASQSGPVITQLIKINCKKWLIKIRLIACIRALK